MLLLLTVPMYAMLSTTYILTIHVSTTYILAIHVPYPVAIADCTYAGLATHTIVRTRWELHKPISNWALVIYSAYNTAYAVINPLIIGWLGEFKKIKPASVKHLYQVRNSLLNSLATICYGIALQWILLSFLSPLPPPPPFLINTRTHYFFGI